MIRIFSNFILIAVSLFVSHPYASLSLLLKPFSVTLFVDAADQDEDTFVNFSGGESEDDGVLNEESKRDGDQKGKLKIKAKFAAPVVSICPMVYFPVLHTLLLIPRATPDESALSPLLRPPPASRS